MPAPKLICEPTCAPIGPCSPQPSKSCVRLIHLLQEYATPLTHSPSWRRVIISPTNEATTNILPCPHSSSHPYRRRTVALLHIEYSVHRPELCCRPSALGFFRCANVASHKPNGTTCSQAKHLCGPCQVKALVSKGPCFSSISLIYTSSVLMFSFPFYRFMHYCNHRWTDGRKWQVQHFDFPPSETWMETVD